MKIRGLWPIMEQIKNSHEHISALYLLLKKSFTILLGMFFFRMFFDNIFTLGIYFFFALCQVYIICVIFLCFARIANVEMEYLDSILEAKQSGCLNTLQTSSSGLSLLGLIISLVLLEA